ncbi:ABC transporter ATP-binding protein [Microbacterium sp. MC2]
MTVALRAEQLVRIFPSPGGDVHACDGIDLTLHPSELLVVRGRSGAGKTTLLNLLGLLDRPTSGRVVIGDTDTTGLPEARLADLRRDRLGFIFQSFGLVPVLSARENVELPLRIAGVDPDERDRRVAEALDRVGLGGHGEQRPGELSGGQQQRVGIARAIVSDAGILIADEPTGQLDSRTAATIMDLLAELAHDRGLATIVTTHDPLLVARADRVHELHDGRIVDAGGATGPAAAPPAETPPATRAELRRRREGR